MKTTDSGMMQAIFRQTLKNLPHRAVQRYVGDRVSLADERDVSRAIRQLASNRKSLKCGLADKQSLIRLRMLVDCGYLLSDEDRTRREPGRSFWYWLPENLMAPVWERARSILKDCGLQDARYPVLMPLIDKLADSVAAQLAEEFRLERREYGSRTGWIVVKVSP